MSKFLDENGLAVVKSTLDEQYADQALIADAYSATSTYAVGDYCIHEGKLYKCNTAIGTAEAWTAAHWTAVKVTSELGSGGGGSSGHTLIIGIAGGHNMSVKVYYADGTSESVTTNATKSNVIGFSIISSMGMNSVTSGLCYGDTGSGVNGFIEQYGGLNTGSYIGYLLLVDSQINLLGGGD